MTRCHSPMSGTTFSHPTTICVSSGAAAGVKGRGVNRKGRAGDIRPKRGRTWGRISTAIEVASPGANVTCVRPGAAVPPSTMKSSVGNPSLARPSSVSVKKRNSHAWSRSARRQLDRRRDVAPVDEGYMDQRRAPKPGCAAAARRQCAQLDIDAWRNLQRDTQPGYTARIARRTHNQHGRVLHRPRRSAIAAASRRQ